MSGKPFCYVTSAGKAVRQDILEQYATKSESRQIDIFEVAYGEASIVEPLYNPHALANLLELNTYHMRCVRTKARDTAGLGWSIKFSEDEPAAADVELQQQIIDAFEDMPVSIAAVFERACTDWEAVSYAAVEIVREDHQAAGDFAKLVHLASPNLRVHRSGNKFLQIVGTARRWFKAAGYDMDVDYLTGQEHELGSLPADRRATELLFWSNYSPRSQHYGLPDIMPAIGAVRGDLSRRDYNIAFFDNFGVPAYAVFITGNYEAGTPEDDAGNPDPKGKTPLERTIEDQFGRIKDKPHSTLILTLPAREGTDGEVKVDFVPLAKEVREASFRLYRQDNAEEVLAAHGVPPYRLGVVKTGALGGSVALETTEIYKTSVIQPRQETLQTLITRHIIWGIFEAYNLRFEFVPIDTTDEKHDLDTALKLFDNAAMSPNALIRSFGERFGLCESDHPAMDAHYLRGTPIDYEPHTDTPDEIIASLSDMQEKLVEVVKKHADGTADGD